MQRMEVEGDRCANLNQCAWGRRLSEHSSSSIACEVRSQAEPREQIDSGLLRIADKRGYGETRLGMDGNEIHSAAARHRSTWLRKLIRHPVTDRRKGTSRARPKR